MNMPITHFPDVNTNPSTTTETANDNQAQSERDSFIDLAERQGWRLIRVDGKKPLGLGWPNSPGLSRQEAMDFPGNIGIICGENSNRLFVVDIDGDIPENLPDTPTVITGGGGRHMYYHLPDGTTITKGNKVSHIADKVETNLSSPRLTRYETPSPVLGITRSTPRPIPWEEFQRYPMRKFTKPWFRLLLMPDYPNHLRKLQKILPGPLLTGRLRHAYSRCRLVGCGAQIELTAFAP